MEKSTDSNTASSSTQPGSCSEGGPTSSGQPQNLKSSHTTTIGSQATNPNDGNHHQQQHHHVGSVPSLLQPTSMTTSSPLASSSSMGAMFGQNHQQNNSCNSTLKNQHNLFGCGPSSSTAASTTSSSSISSATFENSGNLNSRTAAVTSLNNSSLGHHQSCYTNAAAAVTSNGVSAGNIMTTTPSMPSSSSSSTSSQMAPINLNISTTTGGNFSVSVDPQITIENLKKIIAKKLKVAKDRICLLHREKELQDGSLKENNLMDGSKIILIPNVETGLLAQRPENTVMQALESLNDSQVNDFLSGKTPLNLSMRLGDHMMLIQLQLSTVNPVNGSAHSGSNCSSSSRTRSNHHHHHHHHRSSSSRGTSTASAATQTPGAAAVTPPNHSHHHHHHHHHHHGSVPGSIASSANPLPVPPAAAVSAASATTAAATVPNVRKLELDSATVRTSVSQINASSTLSSVSMIAAAPTTMASQQMKNESKRISTTGASPASTDLSTVLSSKNSDLNTYLSKRDYESLKNFVKSVALKPVHPATNSSNTVQIPSNSSAVLTAPLQSSIAPVAATSSFHAPSTEAVLLEQSPIKSLSNLVSSPIKTTPIKSIPNISNNNSGATNSVALGPHTSAVASGPATNIAIAPPSPICQDPIAAKLTSCLCTRLHGANSAVAPHTTAKQCIETSCMSQPQQPQHHHLTPHTNNLLTTSTPNYKATSNISGNIISPSMAAGLTSRSSASLHKTAHNAISRKHRHHHHHHHHHHHYHHQNGGAQGSNGKAQPMVVTSTPTRGISNDSGFNSGDDTLNSSNAQSSMIAKPVASLPTLVAAAPVAVTTIPLTSANLGGAVPVTASTSQAAAATSIELDDSGIVSDSRTLAEASRNLTQTLRKLSKEVFTNKIDFSASEEAPRKSGSGAVIESMKNHGKGIYSGTFSGTLNPALQDRYGRPKRDISTVIHILNDLLSATPQYHRGARISFEAPSTSAAAAASVAAASGSPGIMHHISRSKHLSSKHHHSSHPCVKCIKTQQHASTSSSSLSTSANISATAATNGITTSNGGTSGSSCAYGECNGHYVSKSHTNRNYPCCQHVSNSSSSLSTAGVTGSSSHHHNHNSSSSSSSSHHHHHHHHPTSDMVDFRKVCYCRYGIHSETGEREREYTCQKCTTEMDNIKTKSKLDQLRLVMQQRKQKREARKQKGAPYGARVVSTTTTAPAAGVADAAASTLSAANTTISTPISVAAATTAPSEVSPNHIVEEVDTAA